MNNKYMLLIFLLIIAAESVFSQTLNEGSNSSLEKNSSSLSEQPNSATLSTKQLSDQDLVDVEQLYNDATKASSNSAPSLQPSVEQKLTDEEKKEIDSIQNNIDIKNSQLKSVSELTKLSPFSDVSMIQRKFLPKTERFQIFGALGLSTNSPWFVNAGGKLNFSYNFIESLGIEASAMFLSASERDAAKEIRDNNSLEPERFILTKSNFGLDLVWSPIYGKIAKLNQEIIPFDMYFSIGGGISGTNSKEKNVPTAHIATGQIFALSKAMAFRWDYSWYLYQATPQAGSGVVSPNSSKNLYNDLIFSAGISFFFPEASYR
jgi:outer membrane beta-barrel protein